MPGSLWPQGIANALRDRPTEGPFNVRVLDRQGTLSRYAFSALPADTPVCTWLGSHCRACVSGFLGVGQPMWVVWEKKRARGPLLGIHGPAVVSGGDRRIRMPGQARDEAQVSAEVEQVGD